MFEVGGHALCLGCKAKVEQIWQAELAANVGALNFALGMAEAQVGLPGMFPRFSVPQPTIQKGPVSVNNITVSDSVVGAINTGQVRQIEVAMDRISQEGDSELALSIKEFTEAVLEEKQLETQQKDEILQYLSFITAQCASPKRARQPSIAHAVLDRVGQAVETAKALAPLWMPLLLKLQTLFQ